MGISLALAMISAILALVAPNKLSSQIAHELILFYDVDINDSDYKEKYHIIDDNCETDAMWIEIDKFTNKELKIYPEQVFKYLT